MDWFGAFRDHSRTDGDIEMSNQARYCVIGAGAAGLAAVKTLSEQGFAVDCFEKSDRIGGHWHVDYDALHLITPKSSSFFDGFPMPDSYPMYPSREQVAAYMVSYAEKYGLTRMIRLNTAVERIEPLGERGRIFTTESSSRTGICGTRTFPQLARASRAVRSTRGRTGTRAKSKVACWSWASATPAVISPSMQRKAGSTSRLQCAAARCSSPRRSSAARVRSCRS
jgi:hypothetical protein